MFGALSQFVPDSRGTGFDFLQDLRGFVCRKNAHVNFSYGEVYGYGNLGDLSIAKVYVSIFPTDKAAKILEEIKAGTPTIRHELAQRTKHQLRRTPELLFFLDDSLDYIENIDKSLKGGDNPIEKPDLLPRRKKS